MADSSKKIIEIVSKLNLYPKHFCEIVPKEHKS